MTDAAEKTFRNFDKFGLEGFADKLTAYLLTESRFVDGSYVLSLNSEFGSGKTTFFEMWSNKLASTPDSPEVVYLNAWESDFQGDPLPAIVSALLERLERKEAVKDATKIESIKETTGKLCRFGLSIGSDVVQKVTGIDFIKAGQYAEPKDAAGREPGHACFELFRERQRLFERLKSQLTDLAHESENRILVFVDELDRCRPNYAIEFLETIKHFFDIDGLVFVLGVDKKQLASSAKSLFGQQLDFEEYYRKFAHRNVTLPVKSGEMTKRLYRVLVQEYFSEEAYAKKKMFPYVEHDQYSTQDVVQLCAAFSLNARQTHELFRTAAHVFSTTSKAGSKLLWGWHMATLLMAALSLKDEELYHRMGRKGVPLKEFTPRIEHLPLWTLDGRSGFAWAALIYLGAFGKGQPEELEREFKTLRVWEPPDNDGTAFQSELRRFCETAYGGFEDGLGRVFVKIYEIMEGLRTFAQE